MGFNSGFKGLNRHWKSGHNHFSMTVTAYCNWSRRADRQSIRQSV